MVTREDSRSSGCGFEFQHRILDGFHNNLMQKLFCLFKKTENKQKEAGMAHLKKQ